MKSDIRSDPHYGEIRAIYTALYAPGSGHLHWGGDVSADITGEIIAFVGQRFDGKLEDAPRNALYRAGANGKVTPVAGGSDAMLPRVSPDGRHIAWVVPGNE